MMCAFMMPVMKNDWEVYNTKKSRNNSTSEHEHSQAQYQNSSNLNFHNKTSQKHHRKNGGTDCGKRSLSYHVSPSRNVGDFSYSTPPRKAYHLSIQNSFDASNISSHSDSSQHKKDDRKVSHSSKRASSGSLSKFHTRVVDKLKSALHIDSKSSEDNDNEESGVCNQ